MVKIQSMLWPAECTFNIKVLGALEVSLLELFMTQSE